MQGSRFQRWLPITGILFVAAMIVGTGVAGDSPDSDASDAKITSYLADDSHFHPAITALILVWAASLLLLGFWAVLRTQLRVAEGTGPGGLPALAFGAGIIGVVCNLVGVTTFLVPALAAHDARHGAAALPPSVYRFAQDFGYPVWIMFGIIGALATWGTAAVVWRTRLWGRWYAWISIVVGVVGLASIEFYPLALFALWIVLTSILMLVKPARRAATPSVTGAAAPAVPTERRSPSPTPA